MGDVQVFPVSGGAHSRDPVTQIDEELVKAVPVVRRHERGKLSCVIMTLLRDLKAVTVAMVQDVQIEVATDNEIFRQSVVLVLEEKDWSSRVMMARIVSRHQFPDA